jgi:hypothetical protein
MEGTKWRRAWSDGRATAKWDRVKGWLDGVGWEGSKEAFDLALQHLVTFVHDTIAALSCVVTHRTD